MNAGTFKSPRFILAVLAFGTVATLTFMGKVESSTLEVLGGIALGGYFANNGIKGLLVKK